MNWMDTSAARSRRRRPRCGRRRVPDAEIRWPSIEGSPYAGQVWVVEVELSPKAIARTTAIMTGLLPPMRYATVVYLTAPRPPGGPAGRGLASALGAVHGRDPGPARRVDCGANAMSVLAWLRLTSARKSGS